MTSYQMADLGPILPEFMPARSMASLVTLDFSTPPKLPMAVLTRSERLHLAYHIELEHIACQVFTLGEIAKSFVDVIGINSNSGAGMARCIERYLFQKFFHDRM